VVKAKAVETAVEEDGTSPRVEVRTTEDVMAVLQRPFSASEIKTREGGRGKQLKYVTGASVFKRLIEATGGNYTTELVRYEFLNIPTKRRGQDVEVPAMLALVRLTIPGLGSKEGFGIQILEGGEDMYKGAFTDGVKKAATQLGLALDLYETEEAATTELMPQEALDVIDAELRDLLRNTGVKTIGDLQVALTKEFGTVTITAAQAESLKKKLKAPAF